jgi:hypothetical protein
LLPLYIIWYKLIKWGKIQEICNWL